MLNNSDLTKISILLDEKLEQKLEEKLEQKLEEKLEQKLDEKLEQKLSVKLKPIASDVRRIKTNIQKIEKKINIITNYFDQKYLDHDKRLIRLENKLGFNSTQIA